MKKFLLSSLAAVLCIMIIVVIVSKVSSYIPQLVHQSNKVVLGEKTVAKFPKKQQTNKSSWFTVDSSHKPHSER